MLLKYLQNDVMAESEEILKLGLLFGEDTEATTEDLPPVLSFQHKLIHEYLAAVYIAENVKLDTTSTTFLSEAFPTWEKIETQREVVQFVCGMLANTGASHVVMHVSKILAQQANNDLNTGEHSNILSRSDENHPLSIRKSLQKEGNVSTAIDPYLCEYPTCEQPLAEVMANTENVYITGIGENDALQLHPSTAQIIVRLEEVCEFGKSYDRLWQALHGMPANVIALALVGVRGYNVTKLGHFFQLKYLDIRPCDCSEVAMENLAENIKAWGPQSQLRSCELRCVPTPSSLITALCKCTHLKKISINENDLHKHGQLCLLMDSPPPSLTDLKLMQCSLQDSDINYMTEAIRRGKLTQLQRLEIPYNPVGEVAVGHLLDALIFTRPQSQLELWLYENGVNKKGENTNLSSQFRNEWEAKLKGTNIKVDWEF